MKGSSDELGAQDGSAFVCMPDVSERWTDPSADARSRLLNGLFFTISLPRTTEATHLPSGDTATAPIVLRAIACSIENRDSSGADASNRPQSGSTPIGIRTRAIRVIGLSPVSPTN